MKKIHLLLLGLILLVLNSCFDHHDEITIYNSGRIELVSTIVVTTEEYTKDEVKENIEERVTALKKAGWTVKHKWKKKSHPYKIEFELSNTIHRMYDYHVETEGGSGGSGIYIYKKFSDKQYVISFDLLGDASNRTLTLTNNSIPLYAAGKDNTAEPTRTIKSENRYYMMLD